LVSPLTLTILLGPPILVIAAVYAYSSLRRRKGRRKRRAFVWYEFALSFVSSTWITIVLDTASRMGIEENDVRFLTMVRDNLYHLTGIITPFMLVVPIEIRVVLVLAALIFLVLIPSP